MGEPLRTFETPDGRTLAFAVWGDPDGFPIELVQMPVLTLLPYEAEG